MTFIICTNEESPMNVIQKPKKTQKGIELIRKIGAEGDRIFTTARARELAPEVGLKDAYLGEALYHLRRNGWIVPLRRGLYALSGWDPGVDQAHEFEVAMALVNPAAISHWSALHFHSLTEQVPRKVFVLTSTDASVPRVRKDSVKEGNIIADLAVEYWSRIYVLDPERKMVRILIRKDHA